MSFEIRPATLEQSAQLAVILQEAGEYKLSQGDDMWGEAPVTTSEAAGIIVTGNTFIASIDGKPAASCKLQWSDERIWGPEQGLDGQASYIHRLAVGERFRGLRIGERVLDWASDFTLQNGRPFLRLDCSYLNRGLCNYYERNRFIEVARKELQDPYYAVAYYQKTL